MHARQKHIHFFKFNKLNVYIKCHDRKNSDFINLLYKYYIAYISFIISTLATNYSNNKHTVLQEKNMISQQETLWFQQAWLHDWIFKYMVQFVSILSLPLHYYLLKQQHFILIAAPSIIFFKKSFLSLRKFLIIKEPTAGLQVIVL